MAMINLKKIALKKPSFGKKSSKIKSSEKSVIGIVTLKNQNNIPKRPPTITGAAIRFGMKLLFNILFIRPPYSSSTTITYTITMPVMKNPAIYVSDIYLSPCYSTSLNSV